jgi:hypothetical protein
MLDPWIIEEIKRREQRSRIEQPVVQIPARGPSPPDSNRQEKKERKDRDDESSRGVEIIELGRGSPAASSYGW